MENNNLCPHCFGSKEIVTRVKGNVVETESCNTCDENGHINDELLDILENHMSEENVY